MRRVAFLCCNHDRAYLALAYQAIASLRRWNGDVDVVLFVEATAEPSARRHFRFDGLTIVPLETIPDNHFLLKWQCVARAARTDAAELLYLDVDTVCFGDIARLFDACADADFAARHETQTVEDHPDCQIDFPKLRDVLAQHRARDTPVFNVGVIYLKAAFASALAAELPLLERLVQAFHDHPARYPSRNRRIVDELCLSIVLGRMPPARLRAIDPALSPFFVEYSHFHPGDPGVVMHYWDRYASLLWPNPYATGDGSRPARDPRGILP